MENHSSTRGHFAALFTIIVWSATFISTKVLLKSFTPIEILLFRFVIGFIALFLLYPKGVKNKGPKCEFLFAIAGLCGVTLYFLMENIALTYTTATNVGVIVSISPIFIGLFSTLFFKGEKPGVQFYLGFLCAIIGIILISFSGSDELSINPIGDVLSILSAMVWAIYSLITKKLSSYGFNTIYTTRKIFSYGIIFMIPAVFLMPFELGISRFSNPVNLLNILFLGLGASASCFVTWNFALKILGPVKTSAYIYAIPVITVFLSVLILGETVTIASIVGIILTLVGLFISERTPIDLSFGKKKGRTKENQF